MKPFIALLSIALLLMLPACGVAFFAGTGTSSVVTGTVSVVHLTATDSGVKVTFVTLVQRDLTHDLHFCGNVVKQFPIGSTVRARFTPGISCSSNLVVVILL